MSFKFRPPVFTIKPYADSTLIHCGNNAYWLKGNRVAKIEGLHSAVNSIPLNNTHLLTGGDEGVFILSLNGKISRPKPNILAAIRVSGFARWQQYIVVASIDEGLYFWNTHTNKVYACNSANGLKDNNVFALMNDESGALWVGTSSGVQQVHLNEANHSFDVKQYGIADGYESSETNLNAMIESGGHIWIGTTKGCFIYNSAAEKIRQLRKPVAIIEQVTYSASKKNTSLLFSAWEHLPLYPQIFYRNNNISFNFKGIYLADPSSLLYAYQLSGYDTGFSLPQKQTSINYNNLPPGRYMFKVKAYTNEGAASEVAEYAFIIITPYYKTYWFMLLVAAGLIGLGVCMQVAFAREKRKRIRQIKEIKEKEQQAVREQTAEDFHDELGNKLTRISVLADVLQNKIGPNDPDKISLVEQIKSNALALYTGTKEIIWSLTKESDNLKDVLYTIQQTGVELFGNTDIQFEVAGINGIERNLQIPAGYNRNIIMIFKELMSNSMRHSRATQVIIEYRTERAGTVGIYYTDNGIGFDEKLIAQGNGLKNIHRRAEKINGSFTCTSMQGIGTTCCLVFNL